MTETPFSDRTIYFDASDKLGAITTRMDNYASNAAPELPTRTTTIRHSWDGAPLNSNVVDTTTENHNDGKRSVAGSLSRKSIFTNVDGQPIGGSTFIHGAGTVGPHSMALQNDELALRAASADVALAPRQKSRIKKHEAKEARRLSKIVKAEGKVEKKALSVAINELGELQDLQKKAVKDEAKAHTAHSKILGSLRKCEADYMEAKAKYEATLSRLNAESQALARIRQNAREATEQMQTKSQEVDSLRAMYGVDEREREVKLMHLTSSRSLSLFRR